MASPTFDTLGLHPALLRAVQGLGFVEPTPIQRDAIPPALEGRDLLACAMTGSGKTAAFALPILHRLDARPRARGARVLVLAPTRELAAQVAGDFKALGAHLPFRTAAVYGGVGMVPQENAFRSGVEVLVATPGRLLDHLQHRYARLDTVEFLVLDEADRMLDMGFLPDIRRILRHVPARRQTLFFSATMPPPIATLAREMLHDPVTLAVERKSAPAHGVRQRVFPVPQTGKADLLLDLLASEDVRSVLAFTRTKHRANRLADWLVKRGVAAVRLHGNRSQSQRQKALAEFKSGDAQVLVATDIAARGIDIDDLSHVVNFDVPNDADDYIHRVGRTARANRTGDAITFVSPDEEGDFRAIEKSLGRRIDRAAPAPGGREERAGAEPHAKRPAHRGERRPESGAAHGAHAGHRPRPHGGHDHAPHAAGGARRHDSHHPAHAGREHGGEGRGSRPSGSGHAHEPAHGRAKDGNRSHGASHGVSHAARHSFHGTRRPRPSGSRRRR